MVTHIQAAAVAALKLQQQEAAALLTQLQVRINIILYYALARIAYCCYTVAIVTGVYAAFAVLLL
jgi:hypothetical protein